MRFIQSFKQVISSLYASLPRLRESNSIPPPRRKLKGLKNIRFSNTSNPECCKHASRLATSSNRTQTHWVYHVLRSHPVFCFFSFQSFPFYIPILTNCKHDACSTSPSNIQAELQQIWNKPRKWKKKLSWRIKDGVGLFTETCKRNPFGEAAFPFTSLWCHMGSAQTDLDYGGPCSQLQVAVTHLKLHLLSKRTAHLFLRLCWPLEGYFNEHALCISKRYSKQTLDKPHIFIMVPVLIINIFSRICSQHQVCCGTEIPLTAAGNIQHKSPLHSCCSPEEAA